jgi:hypothetical protein
MSHESTELKIFLDNDRDLYFGQRESIVKALLRRKNADTYDSAKSVKAWVHLAESGARKYAKEYGHRGDQWNRIFSVADRKIVARELRDEFEAEHTLGNYAILQRELETKAQRNKRTGKTPSKGMMRLASQLESGLGLGAAPSFPAGTARPASKKKRSSKKRTKTVVKKKTAKKRRAPARRSSGCTKADAEKVFKATVMPTILESETSGRADRPMRREAWNNFTDGLHRDGVITDHQVNTWGHPSWLETYGTRRRRR